MGGKFKFQIQESDLEIYFEDLTNTSHFLKRSYLYWWVKKINSCSWQVCNFENLNPVCKYHFSKESENGRGFFLISTILQGIFQFFKLCTYYIPTSVASLCKLAVIFQVKRGFWYSLLRRKEGRKKNRTFVESDYFYRVGEVHGFNKCWITLSILNFYKTFRG